MIPAPVHRPARVVLTGPECTGKTTLARELAAGFGVSCVPEHARAHAEAVRPRALTAEDVEPIARGQIAVETAALDAAVAAQARLVVFDTDLISTVVYARHYYGGCPEWIERAARRRRADLYLLCGLDFPWTADGVRDLPHARETMLRAFEAALNEFDTRWVPLRGDPTQRAARAVELIEKLIRDDVEDSSDAP